MKHRKKRDFEIEFFRGNSKWFCKDKISAWQIIYATCSGNYSHLVLVVLLSTAVQ